MNFDLLADWIDEQRGVDELYGNVVVSDNVLFSNMVLYGRVKLEIKWEQLSRLMNWLTTTSIFPGHVLRLSCHLHVPSEEGTHGSGGEQHPGGVTFSGTSKLEQWAVVLLSIFCYYYVVVKNEDIANVQFIEDILALGE